MDNIEIVRNDDHQIVERWKGDRGEIGYGQDFDDLEYGATGEEALKHLNTDTTVVWKVVTGELSLSDLDPNFILNILDDWYHTRSTDLGNLESIVEREEEEEEV